MGDPIAEEAAAAASCATRGSPEPSHCITSGRGETSSECYEVRASADLVAERLPRDGEARPLREPELKYADESLSLGDGDHTSTLFFSSAPPPPSGESVVLEDWATETDGPSEEERERKTRLKRLTLIVVVACAAFAIVTIATRLSKGGSILAPAATTLVPGD